VLGEGVRFVWFSVVGDGMMDLGVVELAMWWLWDGRSFGAMRKLCRGFVVEGERRSVLYERR
jgi:hypothetical protein